MGKNGRRNSWPVVFQGAKEGAQEPTEVRHKTPGPTSAHQECTKWDGWFLSQVVSSIPSGVACMLSQKPLAIPSISPPRVCPVLMFLFSCDGPESGAPGVRRAIAHVPVAEWKLKAQKPVSFCENPAKRAMGARCQSLPIRAWGGMVPESGESKATPPRKQRSREIPAPKARGVGEWGEADLRKGEPVHPDPTRCPFLRSPNFKRDVEHVAIPSWPRKHKGPSKVLDFRVWCKGTHFDYFLRNAYIASMLVCCQGLPSDPRMQGFLHVPLHQGYVPSTGCCPWLPRKLGSEVNAMLSNHQADEVILHQNMCPEKARGPKGRSSRNKKTDLSCPAEFYLDFLTDAQAMST